MSKLSYTPAICSTHTHPPPVKTRAPDGTDTPDSWGEWRPTSHTRSGEAGILQVPMNAPRQGSQCEKTASFAFWRPNKQLQFTFQSGVWHFSSLPKFVQATFLWSFFFFSEYSVLILSSTNVYFLVYLGRICYRILNVHCSITKQPRDHKALENMSQKGPHAHLALFVSLVPLSSTGAWPGVVIATRPLLRLSHQLHFSARRNHHPHA